MRLFKLLITAVLLGSQLTWALPAAEPLPLPPPPPPPPAEPLAPPPAPPLAPPPAPLLPPVVQDSRVPELRREHRELADAPSLGSGIAFTAIGGAALVSSLALFGFALSSLSCGTYCGSSYASTLALSLVAFVAGCVFTPIGIVRMVRGARANGRRGEVEDELQKAGDPGPWDD